MTTGAPPEAPTPEPYRRGERSHVETVVSVDAAFQAPEAVDSTAAGVAPAERSLTATTTHGFAWSMLGTLIGKGVATIGQIALAWILTKEDFGIVATALAIAAFPAVLQSGGLASILVQRQARFHQYVNACFWANAAMSLTASLLVLASAPIAAAISGSSTIAALLPLVALNTLLSGLAAVPYATLQVQLRFKLIAGLNAATTITQMVAAVPLAWAGMGAFSVVLATTLGLIVTLIIAWRRSRPPIRWALQTRRWKYLLGDASVILLTNLLWTVVGQGDRLVLGAMVNKETVGVYFFAVNMSMQISMLLMTNLSGVLFPTFGKLTAEPRRQTLAFLRAARMLAAVSVPAALLQAAMAEPGIRLLFDHKWDEAIAPLRWLSIAMAAYITGAAVTSLLMAQGRFRTILLIALGYTIGFMSLFTVAVHQWGLVGGAASVMIGYTVSSFVGLYLGIRPGGGTLRDVLGIYLAPTAISIIAIGSGLLLSSWIVGTSRWHHLARIGVISATTAILYLPLMSIFARSAFEELRSITASFLRRVI